MLLTGALSTLLLLITIADGQRITTIQLEGVQYFISRMNPYSPELNFFLAYQYCRSLGLQLASFETKEKADSITQYLSNAGYDKFDFWISGNKLGTDMPLWMSTGLPFNATFNYMRKRPNDIVSSGSTTYDIPTGSTSPQRTARESGNNGLANSCVAMKAPTFEWDTDDCTSIKDFICEQTRCYYYNYGSIPVSSAQGRPTTTTTRPSSSSAPEEHKYVSMGINELINKFRTSPVQQPAPVAEAEDIATNTASPLKNEDAEMEAATNGPYDNFHANAEMKDDPGANLDRHKEGDYIASTFEPEIVNTFVRSSNPSS